MAPLLVSLIFQLLDMLRETFNRVRHVVAKFLQHAGQLTGFSIDGSGQSGDAVNVPAAVREVTAEGLLYTAAVAFNGLSEGPIHTILAAVHRRRFVEFPISPVATTAINHAVRLRQSIRQVGCEKRKHRRAFRLKWLSFSGVKVYREVTHFDDVVLAGFLVKSSLNRVRRKIEVKSSVAVVGDESLLPPAVGCVK